MTREELLDKALSCNRCGSCRGVSQDTVPHQEFSTQCPSGMTLFGAYEPSGLIYTAKALPSVPWNGIRILPIPSIHVPSVVTVKTCAVVAIGTPPLSQF